MLMDPDADLDFGVDWSEWLNGDTIATSSWTVTGATAGDDSNTATSTTVWLSAATAGTPVHATNHITTAAGRTDERTLVIQVVQR